MKNKLSDLNNHLFAQLERLGEEDLDQEGIEKEVARTGALVSVTDQIIKNATLQVKAADMMVKHGAFVKRHLKSFPMIEDGSDK